MECWLHGSVSTNVLVRTKSSRVHCIDEHPNYNFRKDDDRRKAFTAAISYPTNLLTQLVSMLLLYVHHYFLRPFDAAVSHAIIAHLTKGNIEMADKIKE